MNNYPFYGPEAPPPVTWPQLSAVAPPQVAQPTPRLPASATLGGYIKPWARSTPPPPSPFEKLGEYMAQLQAGQTIEEKQAAKFAATQYLVMLRQANLISSDGFEALIDNLLDDYDTAVKGLRGGGAGSALGYASLAEEQRQFNETMVFQKEREKQRIQEAMSALGLEGATLQNRALTDASQLVAQVAPFNIPPGMEYLPGREPGGTLSALAQMGGWNYTPERAVGTPINPNIIPQQSQMSIAQALANLGGA